MRSSDAPADLAQEEAQSLGQVHGRPHLVVEIAGEREEVDGLLDDAALQVVAHLDRDVGAHPLLRLLGRGPHVGSGQDARMLGQALVDGRLLGVDVERGAGHPPALERRQQGLVVDELAARRVDDANAGLDLRERLLSDEVVASPW